MAASVDVNIKYLNMNINKLIVTQKYKSDILMICISGVLLIL